MGKFLWSCRPRPAFAGRQLRPPPGGRSGAGGFDGCGSITGAESASARGPGPSPPGQNPGPVDAPERSGPGRAGKEGGAAPLCARAQATRTAGPTTGLAPRRRRPRAALFAAAAAAPAALPVRRRPCLIRSRRQRRRRRAGRERKLPSSLLPAVPILLAACSAHPPRSLQCPSFLHHSRSFVAECCPSPTTPPTHPTRPARPGALPSLPSRLPAGHSHSAGHGGAPGTPAATAGAVCYSAPRCGSGGCAALRSSCAARL